MIRLKILKSIVFGITIIVLAKILIGLAYVCEPQEIVNPVKFSFVAYDLSENGTMQVVDAFSTSGFLIIKRYNDRVYFNLTDTNGITIISSVYENGKYYFVTRDGRLVESGVSPFFLHRPCFDTVIPNLIKLKYFDLNLLYEQTILSKSVSLNNSYKLINLGYSIFVYTEEKLIIGPSESPFIVTPYYSIDYVKGYGIGGGFIVPRDVILIDNLNYSIYFGNYNPVLIEDGEVTFLGGLRGFDVPTAALLPLGIGVGLVLEGVRRVVVRRGKPG